MAAWAASVAAAAAACKLQAQAAHPGRQAGAAQAAGEPQPTAVLQYCSPQMGTTEIRVLDLASTAVLLVYGGSSYM